MQMYLKVPEKQKKQQKNNIGTTTEFIKNKQRATKRKKNDKNRTKKNQTLKR